MIRRVRSVGIWVSDQDKAHEFYINKLGFKVQSDQTVEGYRWLEVGPADGETVLAIVKPYPGQQGATVGSFSGVVFSTDDIETTYQELVAKGVEFSEKPTMQAWGSKQALFVDQDNNGFVLVER